MSYFSRVFGGLRSLLVGMKITLRELFRTLFTRKAVTLQYPHEKPVLSPAYRGTVKLITFEETKSHDCVACLACVRICPSYCIEITGGKVPEIKKKRADKVIMDFALCSLCGLCIDVCPTDTLEYSKEYDAAGFEREWKYDLLQEYVEFEPQFRKEQAAREKIEDEAKAAKKAAAKAAKEKKAAEKAAKEAEAKPAEEAEAEPAKKKAVDKADKKTPVDKADTKKPAEEAEAKPADKAKPADEPASDAKAAPDEKTPTEGDA